MKKGKKGHFLHEKKEKEGYFRYKKGQKRKFDRQQAAIDVDLRNQGPKAESELVRKLSISVSKGVL